MESIFCSKCGTSLVLPDGLENSQFIKCCNCDNTFKNPHFEINNKTQSKTPTPNNIADNEILVKFIYISIIIFFGLVIYGVIRLNSFESSGPSYESNSQQSTQSESSSSSNDNNSYKSNISADDEKKLRQFKDKVQILFDQLMIFKNEKEFQEVGFGECCKYNKWLKDVETLNDTPEAKLFAQRDGYPINSLIQLGRDYIHLEGSESRYTNWNKKRLIEALKEK